MKVLIVSFYYSPELGAAPSRITNLAKGLQEKGIEVELLTCMPNYPKGKIFEGYRRKFSMKEELDGVLVHRYLCYNFEKYFPATLEYDFICVSHLDFCFESPVDKRI